MDRSETCLSGEALYGDDFGPAEIEAWHADEREAYASLGAADEGSYRYAYHALNVRHGFRHLPDASFESALGFGSAYGHEFGPIAARVRRLTIVDPSDAFARDEVCGVPAEWLKPLPDGRLPLPDAAFDLATCLGVLHHIPNVSFVLGDLARTLRPGGYLLLREPIVSMGDWRRARRGLTKHERGIPLPILRQIVDESGLDVVRSSLCCFPLTTRLFTLRAYDSAFATAVDAAMSRAFAWNVNYHPGNAMQRLRPTAVFLVLRKR